MSSAYSPDSESDSERWVVHDQPTDIFSSSPPRPPPRRSATQASEELKRKYAHGSIYDSQTETQQFIDSFYPASPSESANIADMKIPAEQKIELCDRDDIITDPTMLQTRCTELEEKLEMACFERDEALEVARQLQGEIDAWRDAASSAISILSYDRPNKRRRIV